MTSEQLIMQLVIAINEEDLETTMELVDKLNILKPDTEEETEKLFILLQFSSPDNGGYTNFQFNECIDYVLKNLYNLEKNNTILFHRLRNRMRVIEDVNYIRNYIDELLSKDAKEYNISETDLLQTLIESIVKLRDRDEIIHYFTIIQDKFFPEEE